MPLWARAVAHMDGGSLRLSGCCLSKRPWPGGLRRVQGCLHCAWGLGGFGPTRCDFESCHPPARHHPFHALSQPLLHILYNIRHTTRTRTRTCACTSQSSQISAKWGENQSWTPNVSGPVGKQSVIFQSPERGHGGPSVGRRGVRRSRKGYLAPALSKDPQGPLEGWEEYPQLDWRPSPAQGSSGWRRL